MSLLTPKRIVSVFLALLAAVIFAGRCSEREHVDQSPSRATLKADETAKVVVEASKVGRATRQPDGTVRSTRRFVPPEGKTVVTVKTDGKVEVFVRTRGWCLAPGIGGAYHGGKAAGVIDVKWGYWGRVGGVTGFTFPKFDAYIGPSFQVYRNTSLFVGYSLRQMIVAGFRLSF